MKSITGSFIAALLLSIPQLGFGQQNSDTTEKYSDFQFSFIYPLSTNGALAHEYTNRLSINILAGVSGGVEGVEVSGLGAATLGDVDGFQGSGYANYVSGDLVGVQVAGFSNVILGDVEGVQGAGFANVALGTYEGVQASGFSNLGFEKFVGVQASGFGNVVLDSVIGVQASGFGNVALGNVHGVQGSGGINFAMEMDKGVQLAGFLNVVPTSMTGVQVSGFGNFAKVIRGYQIGIVNIADTITDGIPIGFFSYARNGYHKFEVFSSDVMAANVQFKTGVPIFYNIFGVGIQPSQERMVMGATYGVGTSFQLGQRFGLNTDLTSTTLFDIETNGESTDFNSLNRLSLSASYQMSPKLAVFAGGALNFLVHEDDAESLTGNYTYTWDRTDYTYKMGYGFNIGLRF